MAFPHMAGCPVLGSSLWPFSGPSSACPHIFSPFFSLSLFLKKLFFNVAGTKTESSISGMVLLVVFLVHPSVHSHWMCLSTRTLTPFHRAAPQRDPSLGCAPALCFPRCKTLCLFVAELYKVLSCRLQVHAVCWCNLM